MSLHDDGKSLDVRLILDTSYAKLSRSVVRLMSSSLLCRGAPTALFDRFDGPFFLPIPRQ